MSIIIIDESEVDKWRLMKEVEIERRLIELSEVYKQVLLSIKTPPVENSIKTPAYEEPADFIL